MAGDDASYLGFDPDRDIPSLAGKVILITGGTAGIGKETVKTLAKHNPAHIYFTGRNASSAEVLIAEIAKSSPGVSVTFITMDLASLSSVREAATALASQLDRLDILMCNAGIMAVPAALSRDGFEIHFATNHLGHSLLTFLLLPLMERTAALPGADVRFINVTSEAWRAHPRVGIAFDRLRTPQDEPLVPGYSWMRYGQSKLANVLFAAEMARRHPAILSVSVHPGVVETDLVKGMNLIKRASVYIPNKLMGVDILPPGKGCYSQVWCAVADRKDIVNGAWYLPVGRLGQGMIDKDKCASSKELAGKLWDWSEEMVAEY